MLPRLLRLIGRPVRGTHRCGSTPFATAGQSMRARLRKKCERIGGRPMTASLRGRWLAGVLAIGQIVLAADAAQSRPPSIIALDIKQQALGDALNELARQ